MDAGLGGWIGTVVIGGIAGWLASKIMKTDASMGVILNVVVGIVGAVVANVLLGALGFSGTNDSSGLVTKLVVAVFGAVIVLFVVKLVTGRGKTV